MDISNSKPIDDVRAPRDLQPQSGRQNGQAAGPTAASETPSIQPDAEGPLGASTVQNAETQDPAQQKQFRDRLADLVERLNEARDEAGLPGDTEISIEVDQQSRETRFLVVDRESGEVIRRIPDEELKELLREAARNGLAGVIDRQA